MSTAAIMMMTITMSIVTFVTIYFFIKVLRTPSKPDSFQGEEKK